MKNQNLRKIENQLTTMDFLSDAVFNLSVTKLLCLPLLVCSNLFPSLLSNYKIWVDGQVWTRIFRCHPLVDLILFLWMILVKHHKLNRVSYQKLFLIVTVSYSMYQIFILLSGPTSYSHYFFFCSFFSPQVTY